ncbi:phage capsid protein [Lampropedia aestuarii]|uniref:recombination directionality factor n=1 Tax=Lampropedia aestuarii TaxID=2562762 RepID=UPI0024698517|nr:phage capsid protein [Lampropedia aestuarii]MDH5857816.1 phage capsid protein [Lampropedia aestuarii]
MIKGLMMTPPVVGRISIGKIVERNGKRLPEKDDEFTITTQVQNRQGWVLHPLDATLREEAHELAQMTKGIEVIELQEIPPEFAHLLNDQDQNKPVQSTPQASLRDKLAQRAQGQTREASQSQDQAPSNQADNPAQPVARANANTKLRRIPVRLLFNDPSLNLRANYTLFDRTTARPICVGDGQSCKRVTDEGIKQLPCSGPDLCPLAQEGGCKPFGRFHVRIDHPDNSADALSTFVLRTTGINTLRTLIARMKYLQAVSGDLLAYLPLEIRLRGKSTTQSRRTPIYYVDLGVRENCTLEWAIQEAMQAAEQAKRRGYDQQGLEHAARQGYALGLFEELEKEAIEIVQEFYPPNDAQSPVGRSTSATLTMPRPLSVTQPMP